MEAATLLVLAVKLNGVDIMGSKFWYLYVVGH
jgi:hypothetical protein